MPYPFELPPGMQARIEADEKREAAEWQAEQYEKRERAAEMARMAEAREHSVLWSTGHTSAEWREAAMRTAAEKTMRDLQAELGSEHRPAGMWTGADGTVHRFEACEQDQGPRVDPIEAQLARAATVKRSATVLGMVRDLERRRRLSGKHVISRSVDGVSCVDCIAAGASAEESFLLHHDPDDPLPERHVPDHAPQRSGTGRRVPMIYR